MPSHTVYVLKICGRSRFWGEDNNSAADGYFHTVPREGDTVAVDGVPHVLYKVFSVENIDGDRQVYEVLAWGERLVDDEGAIVDPRARLEKQLEELSFAGEPRVEVLSDRRYLDL